MLYCEIIVQVDPKFLRNMRFAKKHNKKHLKQKAWVFTLRLTAALRNSKHVFCKQHCIALMQLWLNAVLQILCSIYVTNMLKLFALQTQNVMK